MLIEGQERSQKFTVVWLLPECITHNLGFHLFEKMKKTDQLGVLFQDHGHRSWEYFTHIFSLVFQKVGYGAWRGLRICRDISAENQTNSKVRREQAALLKEHSGEWMQRQITVPEGMGSFRRGMENWRKGEREAEGPWLISLPTWRSRREMVTPWIPMMQGKVHHQVGEELFQEIVDPNDRRINLPFSTSYKDFLQVYNYQKLMTCL